MKIDVNNITPLQALSKRRDYQGFMIMYKTAIFSIVLVFNITFY